MRRGTQVEFDDIELMMQVKVNDHDAFEMLVEKYKGPIINFFYRQCSSRELSEDYSQEVFIKLWQTRARYKPVGKFSSFLFQIASNHWKDIYRKNKRTPNQVSVENLVLVDKNRGPDDMLASVELSERLSQAIATLPEKYRTTFILSEVNNLSYMEIADILKCPKGTVSSRKSEALKLLRKKLAKFNEEENSNSA